MIAGIELGGTKTVVALGTEHGEVVEEFRFPTDDPVATLGRAAEWIKERGKPDAIGIGAFGPLRVKRDSPGYGSLLNTPKPGWTGFSIFECLSGHFPKSSLEIDTDVNAAALAESRIGASAGLSNSAYVTIGTGIGAGFVIDGKLLHGSIHPEFGHLKLPRLAGDGFPGICPYHADCLEGMASGPAIQQRWSMSAADLPESHAAWETEAWYLAHGILAMLAIVSPERVILGGGVSQASHLHSLTEKCLNEVAGAYFPEIDSKPYVVAPKLGQQAGIIGSIMLAGHGS